MNANKLPFLFFAGLAHMVILIPSVYAASEQVVERPPEVENWFAALGSVNRKQFGELISADAKIILKDLGIEQSKQEFIDALDEWEIATKKANIVYRYQSIEEDTATTLVCYVFESNSQLNLETYTFLNNQITGSVQQQISDNCDNM